MKLDEFSFFNQQLAGMLKDGIPLERGLKQLCASMREDRTRKELELLEADLAKGIPIKDAVAPRQLPDFYKRVLVVGARSNDLPGILLLVADYYSRVHTLGVRLKGLMIYPLIVLLASLALSICITFFLNYILRFFQTGIEDAYFGWPLRGVPAYLGISLWFIPFFLTLISICIICGLSIPAYRRYLRWRVPGFREAGLSQIASTLSLLLRGGSDLSAALALVRQLEGNSLAGKDITVWEQRLASGQGRFAELAESSRAFPPLFVWLVCNGGEDLAAGFARAAEIYYARAMFRAEMILYAVLPVSIFALGGMILFQYYPLVRAINAMISAFS